MGKNDKIIVIDREEDGTFVISEDANLATPSSFILTGKEIEILYKVYQRSKLDKENLENILEYVCAICNVSKQIVLSKNRSIEYAMARQLYCYVARKMTTKSLKTIGEHIRRDHATVKHSVKVIETYLETNNKVVKKLIDQILNIFDNQNNEQRNN